MLLSLRNQKILAGLVATLVPVGYLVGLHIKWMQDPQERIRMAMKHGGFWGGMTASLIGFHMFTVRKRNPLTKDLAIAVGLSLLPIVGYEVSRRVAKKFFPSVKAPSMPMHDPFSQVMQPPAQPEPRLNIVLPPPAPEPVQPAVQSQSGYYGYPASAYSYPYAPYTQWNPYAANMRMTSLGSGYSGLVTHV